MHVIVAVAKGMEKKQQAGYFWVLMKKWDLRFANGRLDVFYLVIGWKYLACKGRRGGLNGC